MEKGGWQLAARLKAWMMKSLMVSRGPWENGGEGVRDDSACLALPKAVEKRPPCLAS